MSTDQSIGGPVSAALEADLRNKVRERGILLWLDMSDDYSGFVGDLSKRRAAGKLPYEVRAFRGSYLELMLELEDLAAGVEKSQLVVHLPHLNDESIKATPLLELWRAGVRYRKKLDTLITEAAAGQVRPEQIDAFKTQDDLSLKGADTWLAELLNDSEGGLGAQLRAMSLNAVVDDLLSGGFVAKRFAGAEDKKIIWERLDAWTGLHEEWRDASQPAGGTRPDDVAFVVSSWALCVEYVHDLNRPPQSSLLRPAKELPGGVVDACRALARHLRERHPYFYQRSADETESLLAEEVESALAEDLGDIDTFRFEETKVLEAALRALKDEQWEVAVKWAGLRIDGGSFWLTEDPSRLSAWQLIEGAGQLGLSVGRAGSQLATQDGLAGAVERYVSHGAAVDRAHRQLEQRRLTLLYPQLPQFECLRARLDDMRRFWRTWADAWAEDFSAACMAHGFLPDASLQQRTLFDEVVCPMTAESGVTAFFVVDALRFEMAEELYEALKDTPATTVRLEPRLSELPSVTEVGMNVLAPVVSRGKLHPSLSNGKIQGFSTGEFRVSNPESRKRAMHDRVGGGTCPWLKLEQVLGRDSVALKRTVAQAKLLVVHSLEIDDAGEKGAGPAVFDLVMQKLRAGWRLLRDAGVRRFVITSDHGFLLLDGSSASAQSHGRKIDPKRRHVFSDVAANHSGEVRVPLASLGYEGVEGHLMFPESTAVFDTGKRSMSFVHGGNSLQERVIPVLTLVHRSAAGGHTLSYGVEAAAQEGVGGMHAVSARVSMAAQGALSFGGRREVELGLSVVDMDGVQVELCQTRGGARLMGGVIHATVDQPFEIFFRLTGKTDARVLVELNHPSAVVEVSPCVLDTRFAVTTIRAASPSSAEAPPAESGGPNWLDNLPEGGVRELFAHLAAHGTVTEAEAVGMLGNQRALRRFAIRFEEHAAKAPFGVRIGFVSGVKRYVREGGVQEGGES